MNKIWMRYKGEGTTHTNMRWFIRDVMVMMGYDEVHMHYPIHHYDPFSENEWIRRNKYGKMGVYHEFDDAGITYNHYDTILGRVRFVHFIEIDGEWHDTREQKNKDDTAEEALREYYKKHHHGRGYRLTRLKKPFVLEAMKTHDLRELTQELDLPGSKFNVEIPA